MAGFPHRRRVIELQQWQQWQQEEKRGAGGECVAPRQPYASPYRARVLRKAYHTGTPVRLVGP